MLRAFACAVLFSASGCATIIHQTTQNVSVTSEPSKAKVTVDSRPAGFTPTIVNLSRSEMHVIRIELSGYKPFEMTVTKSMSGWVWGNIVFGGLIGLGVDALSGGLYNLSPEQLHGALELDAQQSQPQQAMPPASPPPEVTPASITSVRLFVLPPAQLRGQQIGQLEPG